MAKKDLTKRVPPLDAGNVAVEPDRTIYEACCELRCSPSTAYRLINSGELTAYKRGDRTIIEGPSLTAMKERNRIAPGTFTPDAAA